nr:uncharacterized protein LOC111510971 [Leptinotarsa decemlineata]
MIYLYSGSDPIRFKRFISLILLQPVGIGGTWILLKYFEKFKSFPELIQTFCWTWDSTRREIFDEIQREYKFIPLKMKIFLVISLLCTPVYLFYFEYTYELVLDTAKNKCGRAGVVLCILYYLVIIEEAYAAACIVLVGMYVSVHIKFQLRLLADYVETIINTGNNGNYEEFNQGLIYQKLKVCVEQHIRIKQLGESLFSIEWSVVTFALGGVAHHAGMIWLTIMEHKIFPIIMLIIGTLVGFAYGFTLFHYGQNIKNESTNFYNKVCSCQWNEFSKENRMALQMIMINSAEAMSLSSFGLVELDYVLATRVYRTVYTFVTLLMNLK